MEKDIIIGFDAKRIFRNRTGLGNYGRTLIHDLVRSNVPNRSFRLYSPDEGLEEYQREIAILPNTEVCYAPPSLLPFSKALWRSWGIVRDLQRDKVELYHGLSGELPIGIRNSGIRSIVTIHDLIFMRHPEFYPFIDRQFYVWKFRRAIREADHIVAISQRTKLDIVQLGGVDPTRISVVYQSCGAKFKAVPSEKAVERVVDKYRLPERYILSVGSIEERKNALLTVRALHSLPVQLHLVLVGKSTNYVEKIKLYLSKHPELSSRVHFYHGIANDALAVFYRKAEVFAYPSRYEGFGIPVIEAIRCGLPVVACTGSCLEEAGGAHCLYVDPDDELEMARAIRSMLIGAPGREERIAKSIEYVQRFENTNVAEQMLDLYDRVQKAERR